MRGLLVVECLYHQIISGRKTQTRRTSGLEVVNENPDQWMIIGHNTHIGGKGYPEKFKISINFCQAGLGLIASIQAIPVVCHPRYKIGEVLYLKEPTANVQSLISMNGYAYRYGAPEGKAVNYTGQIVGGVTKWSNKLFMPASAARALIKITGIRCERLMDISDHDCIAEGIERIPQGFYWKDYGLNKWFDMPKDSFITLYTFANKMKRMDPIGNPWCWVYEFTYLKNYKP